MATRIEGLGELFLDRIGREFGFGISHAVVLTGLGG
jgi:hypothetical protein